MIPIKKIAEHYSSLLGACALLLFTGCNSSDLPLVAVSGVVLKGSEPLAGIRVNSFPSSGPVAAGITDSSGEFHLQTGEHDGALVGSHVIVLAPPAEGIGMPGLGEVSTGPKIDEKSGVPRQLQIRDESPLKITLEDDAAREIVIDVDAGALSDAE